MARVTRQRTERGIALVVALLMMLTVTMIGAGLTVAARSGIQIGTSFTAQQVAFQAAEAGLEHARGLLRLARYQAGVTQANFTPQLSAAAGDDGLLVASNDLTNFGTTNGFLQSAALDDIPVRVPTELFGASYQVFLTNDPVDGIVSTTDSNNIITLTAFGSGPNGVGFAAVQGVYETIFSNIQVPDVPGVVTLLGPNVEFGEPTSKNFEFDGDAGLDPDNNPICYPSIATTSNDARDAIRLKINGLTGGKDRNFHTCDPTGGPEIEGAASVINYIDNNAVPSINPYQSILARGPEAPLAGQTTETPPEITVDYWDGVIAQLSTPGVANYVGPDTGKLDFGTVEQPRVVVVTGDLAIRSIQCPEKAPCSGILLVQGDLKIDGGVAYQGIIYAVGKGNVTRDGSPAPWCGGIVVADIVNDGEPEDHWIPKGYVGQPSYNQQGGSTSSQGACDFARQGGDGIWGTALIRKSFQQLRDSS